MADENYARLLPGGLSLAALISQKRGRGRPKGLADTKPRRAYTPKSAAPAVCADCGQGFTKRLPRERFCSDQCRHRTNNRVGQERRRNSSPRPCRWCQKEYTPEYGSLRTYYCTTDCRDAASRKQRSGNTHRRRIKKYGVHAEPVNRLKVFERDGWKCQLCGIDTPQSAMDRTRPDSPELDHIDPISRGGPHTYANTQCMCRACNRWKRDRTMSEARAEWRG